MNLFDDIASDVQEYAKNVCKYSAIEVREELYKTANEAIDYFYATYTPGDYSFDRNVFLVNHPDEPYSFIEVHSVYQRNYNLYKSFEKYYKNNHDKTFSGGIVLSPELMKDIYRGSRELVFDLAYRGYHGLDSWNQTDYRPARPYGVTIPSPMEIIERKEDNIYKHPTPYVNKAVKKANKEKYLIF